MARSRITSSILTHLQRPQANKLFLLPPAIRALSYPKEGVFQPNSPKRDIPGFGPPPPQFQDQQQPLPQQQNQYFPRQEYPQGPFNGGQEPQHNQPPPSGFYRPRLRSVVLGLLLVLSTAYLTTRAVNLLDPLEPGSPEDKEELEILFEELDAFQLVKQLRDMRSTDGRPLWKEYTAYSGLTSDARRDERLTTGPLAGSRGVAAQRVFINEETGVLHLFINFGPATCGWPGMVHGGVISTICDEALGRVAIRGFEGRTGVTASLEVNYLDKVIPGIWYVLVAAPEAGGAEEQKQRKRIIEGHLLCLNEDAPRYEEAAPQVYAPGAPTPWTAKPEETPKQELTLLDSHPHVKCRALFVSPKNVPLNPIPDEF